MTAPDEPMVAIPLSEALRYAPQLAEFRRRSGLAPAEFARALGVTTRTLRHWERGGRVAGRHEGAFRALAALVDARDTGDPSRTRAALVAPDAQGVAPLTAFMAAHRSTPRNPEGFTPGQLIGANGDPHA